MSRGLSTTDMTTPVGNLDKRLRQQARAFDHSWERLEPLIIEAREREIHKALGFTSWPEYIADVARREMPNVSRSVEQRRELVALLAGEGMSQRAIADATGVSQSTVRDDVAEVSRNHSPDVVVTDPAPATVTGRDGKQYPAKPKPKPKPEPKPEPEPDDDESDWFMDVMAGSISGAPARMRKLRGALRRQYDQYIDQHIEDDLEPVHAPLPMSLSTEDIALIYQSLEVAALYLDENMEHIKAELGGEQ